MSDSSRKATLFNITLTLADTEYSQLIPSGVKELRFRCRTLHDVRYGWESGVVATPTEPYCTLPSGHDYASDKNDLTGKTLYIASSTAGVVVELEVWE